MRHRFAKLVELVDIGLVKDEAQGRHLAAGLLHGVGRHFAQVVQIDEAVIAHDAHGRELLPAARFGKECLGLALRHEHGAVREEALEGTRRLGRKLAVHIGRIDGGDVGGGNLHAVILLSKGAESGPRPLQG